MRTNEYPSPTGSKRALVAGPGVAACLSFVLGSAPVSARPVACDALADEGIRAAVAMADAQVKALWLAEKEQLAIAYRLKGEAAAPVAVPGAAGQGGLLFPKGKQQVQDGIDGLLVVERLDCTVYEIGPPRAFVVSYRATGLRFREGAGAWSPRLAHGLVHALAVRQAAGGGNWAVSPMPGARTSLPEDAVFSRPAGPVDLPQAARAR